MRIAGYDLKAEIGSGGMGAVYKAVQVSLDRTVAIKVVHKHLAKDPSIRTRFFTEAKLTAALSHPHIVQVYDFLESDQELLIVMEYIDGRCLSQMIGQEVGPIPWEKALPLFFQILSGVGYAHSRGIVHRDIKPANILLSTTGDVKITDFGIAKISGQKGMTRTGAQMGTLYYESPEQITGAKDVDHRTDLYALGMTLYEMLAGRLPFDKDGGTSEFQVMNSIVNREAHLDPREYYPHIPEWLVGVVQKATELDPDSRFQSCEAFQIALEQEGKIGTGEHGYWSGKVASVVPVIAGVSPSTPAPLNPENSCPKCRAPVEKEMEFCAKCGANLHKECPGCKKRIRWHHEFCPKCGVNFSAKQKELEAARNFAKLKEEKRREAALLAEQKRKKEEARKQEEARIATQKLEEENRKKEEERVRLREERIKALEEKRAKRIAWWKQHWLKTTFITAAFIAIISIISYYTSDKYRYEKALKHEEEHRWEEAALVYEGIGDYEDAESRYYHCLYIHALELEEEERYLDAAEAFTTLDDYNDSYSHMEYCYLLYAEQLAEQGDAEGAAGVVTELRNMIQIDEQLLATVLSNQPSIVDMLLPNEMVFISVPAGNFDMGGNLYSWERPIHEVHVDSFEIMMTEVTQGMWEEVMGNTLEAQAQTGLSLTFGVGENFPMYYVSWFDCEEFTDELNLIDPSHSYRLPTEAEWEFACRGDSDTEYHWGDDSSPEVVSLYAWFGEDPDIGSTHQVGLLSPNSRGLHDMSGNVWEWCLDSWHDSYWNAPDDGSEWSDQNLNERVIRGGCWFGSGLYCRSANRGAFQAGDCLNSIGFRVVRTQR